MAWNTRLSVKLTEELNFNTKFAIVYDFVLAAEDYDGTEALQIFRGPDANYKADFEYDSFPLGEQMPDVEVTQKVTEFEVGEATLVQWEVLAKNRWLEDQDKAEVENNPYGLTIHICGSKNVFWQNVDPETDFILDYGDYRPFRATLEGDKNYEALLNEVCDFLKLGVDKIAGGGPDPQEGPSNWHLVYRSSAQAFLPDFSRYAIADLDAGSEITEDQIIEAVLMSDATEMRDVEKGYLIYSKEQTNGELLTFYQNLAKVVQKGSGL